MSGVFEALQRCLVCFTDCVKKLMHLMGMQHTAYYARLSQGPCDFRPVSTESTSRINMKSHETPACYFSASPLDLSFYVFNNCPSPTSI